MPKGGRKKSPRTETEGNPAPSIVERSPIPQRVTRTMSVSQLEAYELEYTTAKTSRKYAKAELVFGLAKLLPGFTVERFPVAAANAHYHAVAQALIDQKAEEGESYAIDDDAAIAEFERLLRAELNPPTNPPVPQPVARTNQPVSSAAEIPESYFDYTLAQFAEVKIVGNSGEKMMVQNEEVELLTLEQIIKAMPDSFITSQSAIFEEWRDALRYYGFQPARVATYLWNAKPEKSNIHDILFLVVVGCERGNAHDKILKSMKDTTIKTYLERLIARHEILTKLPKEAGEKKANAITLSRICMAFPTLTCSYYPQVTSPTVSWIMLDKMLAAGVKYNRHMAHAAFASLIPKTVEDWYKIMGAHMLHQVMFAFVVNRGLKQTKKEAFLSCLNYSKASLESTWVQNDRRVAKMKEFKVIDENLKLTPEVLTIYAAFLSYVSLSDDDVRDYIM